MKARPRPRRNALHKTKEFDLDYSDSQLPPSEVWFGTIKFPFSTTSPSNTSPKLVGLSTYIINEFGTNTPSTQYGVCKLNLTHKLDSPTLLPEKSGFYQFMCQTLVLPRKRSYYLKRLSEERALLIHDLDTVNKRYLAVLEKNQIGP